MLCDEKKAQERPQPIRPKSIRLQPIRPIYKPCPSTTTTTPPDLEIVQIVIQQDSEGKEIVLWEDIVDAFRDAVNVRHGTMILPFLKDKDLKRLHPPRIAAMPNTVLDVLVDTPTTLPVVQSNVRQSATQSPLKPAPSPYSSTPSRQRQQRPPKNISIAIVTEEFGKIALMARRGDSKSQTDLAKAFHRGSDGLSKNYELALKWFLRAAEQEDPIAETNVGFLIMNGQGAPRDTAKATMWYLKAADRGCADGQYRLGELYSHGVHKDYPKAMEWLIKAANQGHAEAQTSVGNFYLSARGVDQDYSKAVKWFAKSAAQGHAHGQGLLAMLYHQGDGVPQDYSKAAEWFNKAADQGDANSQNGLGTYYNNGIGVPQDFALAAKWFLKAASQGQTLAQVNLGILYTQGQGVSQDHLKAVEWFSKAAHRGYAEAQFRLGYALERGRGVPKDDSKALEWYFKAATQGHPAAQAGLGVSYHDGLGVPQDFALAMEWYLKAAGQAEAQVGIGMLYHNGEGVVRNPTKAMKWYMKAANQGSKEGQKLFEKLKAKGYGSHLELALPPAYEE